jgi:GNAT superfamily N-acetyltransferase
MPTAESFEIRRDDDRQFAEYGSVSSAFVVRERVDLGRLASSSPAIPTCSISSPWVKDYDAIPGNAPASWPAQFDVREWAMLAAYVGPRRVGGAIVVTDASALTGVGGRPGCGLLWDVRVAQDMRGRGIGRSLLAGAEHIAAAARRRALDVETQDINVPACRLYAAAGYQLLELTPDAYPRAPSEARLVWTKAFRLDFTRNR